jgi:hypothetical protein
MSTSVFAQQKLTDEEKQMLEQQESQVNQAQPNQDQPNQAQPNQAQPNQDPPQNIRGLVGFGLGAPFGHGLMFGSSIKVAEEFDLRLQVGIGLRYVETSALLYHELKRKHSIGIGYHFNLVFYAFGDLISSVLESDEILSPMLLASSVSLLYKYEFTDNGKHEVTIGLSPNLFVMKVAPLSEIVNELPFFLYFWPTLGYNYKF